MATIVQTSTKAAKKIAERRYDHPFFLGMVLLLAVVAAIGFAPTYYLAGGPRAPLPSRIVHVHAAMSPAGCSC